MLHILFISLLFIPLPSLENDMVSLQHALDNKTCYDIQKERTIDSLHRLNDPAQLYEAYSSYCYDSAYYYAQECIKRSKSASDNNSKIDAQLKLAYTYMSGGLFSEAESVLNSVDIRGADTAMQMGYFSLQGQLQYNISRYQQTPYPQNMRDNYEKVLKLLSASDSLGYWNVQAQLARADGKNIEAIECFEHALCAGHGILRSEAISYSSIAQEFYDRGDSAQALHYWIHAAIRDLECSAKEVTAMQHVAKLLHNLGRYDFAARTIRSALDDAQHFHARHRMLEVGEILPIIDQYQLQQLQEQSRHEHILYSCIFIILILATGILLILFQKLHLHNRMLLDAQNRIMLTNVALEQSNHLKEAYLATMLSAEADHTEAVERYVKYVTRCAREKNWEDALSIPQYISKLSQRTAFFRRFDSMFLQLYPHFIDEINARLVKPMVSKRGTLPGELRIFALMRLGIHDNEQMAHILSCSLATIHTYKAHVYSRLNCSKDIFLQIVSPAS